MLSWQISSFSPISAAWSRVLTGAARYRLPRGRRRHRGPVAANLQPDMKPEVRIVLIALMLTAMFLAVLFTLGQPF
jgi:hypothetical protein